MKEVERLIAKVNLAIGNANAEQRPLLEEIRRDLSALIDQSSSSLAHPEQGWQPMLQRAHEALDAADRLMAGHIETFFPMEKWQEWRRQHRQALCDVLPLPLPPSPTDSEKKK